MTTEEKAKAYDSALEQAKKELAVSSPDSDSARQIFRFFPELRKEEKPLTPFQQCLNCILRGVYYAEVPDKKVNQFIVDIVRTRTDELIKLAKKHEYTNCQLHENEDERIRKYLIEELKAAKSVGELRFAIPQPTREECIAYLEKQKDKMTAEEHETVKVNINGIHGLFPPVGDGHYIDEHVAPDKTAGEKQKEQKLAEWSEEDEKRIQRIYDFLWKNRKGDTDTIYQIEKDADWLKSLRPSWKPSEEQMDALNALNCHGDLSYVGQQNQLISLYNDLKKL